MSKKELSEEDRQFIMSEFTKAKMLFVSETKGMEAGFYELRRREENRKDFVYGVIGAVVIVFTAVVLYKLLGVL